MVGCISGGIRQQYATTNLVVGCIYGREGGVVFDDNDDDKDNEDDNHKDNKDDNDADKVDCL